MPSFDPYAHLIKPMLAESRETPFDSSDHIYELKWDGTRAICFRRDQQRFQNRRMTFIEQRYPDLKVRTKKPAILDGEIVVMWDDRPSFEKLQERERPGGKIHQDYLVKTLPATYVAFDVLYIGTENVMGQTQMERKALLREVLEEDRSSHAASRESSRNARTPAMSPGNGARTGSRSRRRRPSIA